MDQIEIVPAKNGTWNWQRRVGEKVKEKGDGYDDRRSAIDAGRVARDGERVVLLRLDGSLHGELDHAERDSDDAQNVTLEPAGETGEAG